MGTPCPAGAVLGTAPPLRWRNWRGCGAAPIPKGCAPPADTGAEKLSPKLTATSPAAARLFLAGGSDGQKHPVQRHARALTARSGRALHQVPRAVPQAQPRSHRDGAIGIIRVQVPRPWECMTEQLVGHIIADEQPVDMPVQNAGPGRSSSADTEPHDEGDDRYFQVGCAAPSTRRKGRILRPRHCSRAGEKVRGVRPALWPQCPARRTPQRPQRNGTPSRIPSQSALRLKHGGPVSMGSNSRIHASSSFPYPRLSVADGTARTKTFKFIIQRIAQLPRRIFGNARPAGTKKPPAGAGRSCF